MPKPLVCARPWFAWRPVKTTNKRIAWLRILVRHRHIPHAPYTRTGSTGNTSTPLTSLTPKGHTHERTNGKTVIDRATKTVRLCQPRKADGTTADSHGGKPNCPQTGKNDAEKYPHATKAYANYDSKDARIAQPTLTTSNAETTTTLKTCVPPAIIATWYAPDASRACLLDAIYLQQRSNRRIYTQWDRHSTRSRR